MIDTLMLTNSSKLKTDEAVMKRYALMILFSGATICSMEKDYKDSTLLNCLITIYQMDKIQEQFRTASPELDAFKRLVIKQAGHLTQELSKDRLIKVLQKVQLYVAQPTRNPQVTNLDVSHKVKTD